MDDMDLPPSDSEGEYEDEEEVVIRGKNGNDIDEVSTELPIEKLEKISLEVSKIELKNEEESSHHM
jgi:hypothetical protein